MNERRQKLESQPPRASLKCECECNRVECFTNFDVTFERYEDVRAHARCFVVAPGHQSSDESVVSSTSRYLVIEKAGRQGVLADALDPRVTRGS